ncbi:MAG TPA: hypothetical protein VFA44_10685 [Gaiellaceae bacterium]|nr:hypothetical protein [Gaiellaceae bacterium]
MGGRPRRHRQPSFARAAAALAAALSLVAAAHVSASRAAPGRALQVKWTGTVDGAGTVAGAQTCTGTWQGSIEFTVTGSTVTGDGQVDLGSFSCSVKLPTPDVEHVDFTLTGTKEETAGQTHFRLLMHPKAISPAGYDPSGFLLHFGQAGEGIPLVLTPSGNRIDQRLTSSVATSNSTVTLDDHFVLRSSCDPDLLDKAERELETGNSFARAASKELAQAANEFTSFEKEYAKESGEVAAEKLSLLQAAEGVDHALEVTPLVAYADLAQALEIAGLYGGLIVTAEELYTKIIPAFRERSKLADEAAADMKRAEQWWKRGNADLKAALAQGPCVGPAEQKLNDLLDAEKRKEKARRLIDSWQSNGILYLNPATGELLDERAALKQAAAIVGASRSPQALTDDRAKIEALGRRLRAALKLVGRALSDHRAVARRIARFRTTSKRLLRALPPLLS